MRDGIDNKDNSSPLLICGGDILSLDERFSDADSVLISEGRVMAVGRRSQLEQSLPEGTREYSLNGLTLTPGFNDAHIHTWKVGHMNTSMMDVRGIGSIEEMLEAMREFARTPSKNGWFQGRGYNEANLKEQRHLNRHDLDQIFPNKPAFLIRTCAHIAIANSKALELAGVGGKTVSPPGGEIEVGDDGEPTGLLKETAMGLVANYIPAPTLEDYQEYILEGQRLQLQNGITSATDPAVTPQLIDAYKKLHAQGRNLNRHNLMSIRRPDGGIETLPLPDIIDTDTLRLDTIKLFSDGGLSGATAALKRRYKGLSHRGVLRLQKNEIIQLAEDAVNRGFRVGTHAIGDDAIDHVVEAYIELCGIDFSRRHRIEHLGLPTQNHLEQMNKYHIFAVPQPTFIRELGGNFSKYLDSDYLASVYPIKRMLEAGVSVALSSDAPVVKDFTPMKSIHAAVTRESISGEVIAPGEEITVEEALYGYTMGGAEASGDEANRGSITPGKWADFTILSDNPTKVQEGRLKDIEVVETWVSGRKMYDNSGIRR